MLIRQIKQEDHEDWAELYRGYLKFYNRAVDEKVIKTLWSWLLDSNNEVRGLVVELNGKLQAFAHYRTFARPIIAGTGIFLDDLFTSPNIRGRGAASGLLKELRKIAKTEGASIVRWITAADNHTAKSLYAKEAQETNWITYDMGPV